MEFRTRAEASRMTKRRSEGAFMATQAATRSVRPGRAHVTIPRSSEMGGPFNTASSTFIPPGPLRMATLRVCVPPRERVQSIPTLVAAIDVTEMPLSCSMAVRTASYHSDSSACFASLALRASASLTMSPAGAAFSSTLLSPPPSVMVARDSARSTCAAEMPFWTSSSLALSSSLRLVAASMSWEITSSSISPMSSSAADSSTGSESTSISLIIVLSSALFASKVPRRASRSLWMAHISLATATTLSTRSPLLMSSCWSGCLNSPFSSSHVPT
mmetsp:Transcript_9210/g.18465  ORF Transcript_9210/g.18465 Transcript_9210/m.18465 type:complete len:273 (+) Transcript_9210:381-1199(+)